MTNVSEKTGLKVFLVDDDEDFLEQMKIQLESRGHEVMSACCQEDAEALLAENKPDVAVLDLMMENQDAGFILAYKVKKLDPSIPVVLVTAVTSETGLSFDGAEGTQHGWVKADAVLPKPLRFEQLERELDRLLAAE